MKGKALLLDGIDEYMAFPTRSSDTTKQGDHLNIKTDDYSFSFWLKNPASTWGRILSKGDVNSEKGYDILINPQGNTVGISLRLRDAGNTRHDFGISYTNPQDWHHVTFTLQRSSGLIIAYVDGVEAGRATRPIASGSLESIQPFIVGASPVAWLNAGATYDLYKGSIDELRLYNRVLSSAEIQQLAGEKTSSTRVSIRNGLTGHWSFDESSYVYMPEVISQSFGTYFTLPAGVSIDRIALNEVIDRVTRIRIVKESDGSIVGEVTKKPTGKANTTTFLDLPTPIVQSGAYNLRLNVPVTNDPHTRTPLVWEAGLLQTTPVNAIPFSGIFRVGMQFRSASSSERLASAPWTGPDGTAGTYYTTSGQQLHQMHNSNQYYQYRISASTPDTRYSPVIDNISISYSGRINRAPVARLKNPGKFFVDEEKELNASRSFDDDGIILYKWDFGDGQAVQGTEATVRHRYTQAGDYFARLTVLDAQGAQDDLYFKITVEPFNCLTPDSYGTSEPSLTGLGSMKMQLYALEAVQEYATAHQLPDIRYVDTAEEYMDAALEYLDKHMSYLATRAECFTANGGLTRWPVSFTRIKEVTPRCGCPGGAAFCGNCIDYATAFASLTRAMGVHSKCVYVGVTETVLPFQTTGRDLHAYNIILYHGKYRTLEPQESVLTSKFESKSLRWSNGQVPFLLTGNVYNDKQGTYDLYDDPIASREGTLTATIMNYPGNTGAPDPARQCTPAYYNLSIETQRLALVQELLRFSREPLPITALTSREIIDMKFMMLVGRVATVSEAASILNAQDSAAYMNIVKDEFKQKFTRFALSQPSAVSGAFMTVPASSYSTLLYQYMMGYTLTDDSTTHRGENAQHYHTLTDYVLYRAQYTNYDPLEVFSDVCA